MAAPSSAGLPDEITIAEEINTRRGVERIIRYAFHWARENGREHVTMADKANAIPAHMIWRRVFDEVGKEEFPDIHRETRYIDAMAMELVRNPEQFQVIVTGNLFGDILSDLASALVGGLGLAPSANRHPGFVSMFEPVHGSAPPLARKDVANPMAAILSLGDDAAHGGLARGSAHGGARHSSRDRGEHGDARSRRRVRDARGRGLDRGVDQNCVGR